MINLSKFLMPFLINPNPETFLMKLHDMVEWINHFFLGEKSVIESFVTIAPYRSSQNNIHMYYKKGNGCYKVLYLLL